MQRSTGTLIGVDFGAPMHARDQRCKIIAVEAQPAGWRRYEVLPAGMNERLVPGSRATGWSARELLDALLARPVRVAAFDFPFCVPDSLLRDERFSRAVGEREPFMGWRAFNAACGRLLPLSEPLDFDPFVRWRHAEFTRAKRATDRAANAQPPLKDRYQSLFQMTILGNALLARMWESKLYRVGPFGGSNQEHEAIEVYPAVTLRRLGMRSYKKRPREAIRAFCETYQSSRDDHDGADALVALVTAIFYAEGLCQKVMPEDASLHTHEVEGAIFAPRA